jgi:fructose-1,6-bisphosphatase/inositol monophosphatase family enzyme
MTALPLSIRPPEPLRAFAAFLEDLRAIGKRLRAAERDPHNADARAETEILVSVRSFFSCARVLSEEYFAKYGTEIEGDGPLRAVVDPIDGSSSFFRGEQTYTTSIAFELDDVPAAAAVYHPATDDLYVAVRGQGAFLNGRPLVAPTDTDAVDVAVRSTLHDQEPYKSICDALGNAGFRVTNLQSTSLKLCLVARGECAGVVKNVRCEQGLMLRWGVEAGALIARESGIAVHDLERDPWSPQSSSIIVLSARARAALSASPEQVCLGPG